MVSAVPASMVLHLPTLSGVRLRCGFHCQIYAAFLCLDHVAQRVFVYVVSAAEHKKKAGCCKTPALKHYGHPELSVGFNLVRPTRCWLNRMLNNRRQVG